MTGRESDPSVAVIGAGAVGATAAFDLADRGADVTLYERREVAGGSSGRAAGVVYDAFAGAVDARIAKRSVSRFRSFSGGGSFEFSETPYVWLAHEGDERRAELIREQVPRMREHGLDVSLYSASELADEFPAIRADDVSIAAVTPNAGHVDTTSYVELLVDRARAVGATVRTGVDARIRIDPPRVLADGEERSFDAVLVAAGAWTKRLLADAGIAVPLKAYRVQALTTDAAPETPMVYDATDGYYLRPHEAGLLAGDGTEEWETDPDEYEQGADDSFVATMRERLAHRIPDADHELTDAWAGVCVATPDRDPLLGAIEDGLYVAAGWQGHGFMRAPGTAEAAVDAVLDGREIESFDPNRFDGDEEFEIVEGMAID